MVFNFENSQKSFQTKDNEQGSTTNTVWRKQKQITGTDFPLWPVNGFWGHSEASHSEIFGATEMSFESYHIVTVWKADTYLKVILLKIASLL